MNHNRQLAFDGREFTVDEKRDERTCLEDEGTFQARSAEEDGADWTEIVFEEAIELLSSSYVNPYSVALGLRRGEPARVRLPFVYVRWKNREEVVR